MSESPFYKQFTSDFLNGIVDLVADEIGVYVVCYNLMYDRNGPIPDDPQWLARRCGTTTHRFNKIRAKLIKMGKLEVRGDQLGQPRTMKEIAKRQAKSSQARSAAMVRWNRTSEPEFDLDEPDDEDPSSLKEPVAQKDAKSEKKQAKTRRIRQTKIDLNSEKKQSKSQKTAKSGNADAFFSSRARVNHIPDSRIKRTSAACLHASEKPIDPDDLSDALRAVLIASGYSPDQQGQIDQAYDFTEKWLQEGCGLDEIILPTIKAIVARSDDPTSSLKRFDKPIMHQRAKASARPESFAPPKTPRFDQEPDQKYEALRRDFLSAIGLESYCHYLNDSTIIPIDEKPIIQINGPNAKGLSDGKFLTIMRIVGEKHGLSQIWTSKAEPKTKQGERHERQ